MRVDASVGSIAAIVVLYRPARDVADNIRAVASQVEHVFAIDNTEEPDEGLVDFLAAIPNLTHVPFGDNMGVARALNAGVERARDNGHAWALTMDQDSTPDPGMVRALAACAGECGEGLPIGMVGPAQVRVGGPARKAKTGCVPALTLITSGCLLSVAAWEAVGRFDEGLFIDQVDHELCLRMHHGGFAVLRCRDARLVHRLGETVRHTFPVTNYATHHPALRRYYITRNRFEVARRFRDEFPEYRRREMRALRHELVKIVLYEQDKVAKLLMSWRGYRDFRRGVSGRFER